MSPPRKAADGGKAAWPATNVAARRVRARGARPKQPRLVTVACHGVASERSETRRRKLRRSGDGRMAGRQHAPARITPGVVTANPHGKAVFEENEFEWRRHECAKRPTGVPRHAFRGGWTCFPSNVSDSLYRQIPGAPTAVFWNGTNHTPLFPFRYIHMFHSKARQIAA